MSSSSDALVRLRRELHQHPEVGLDLPWTQQRLLTALDGLGLEISTGTGCSSLTAVLRGEAQGRTADGSRPTVLVRSDMDALPMREETGVEFASENEAMHACGHDLHMAMLVGAVERLARRRAELAGDVVFVFQPGEENWGGARMMLDEGLLQASGRTPDAALGLHVFSYELPHGVFGLRRGPMLSASDLFTVVFHGRGGHGSAPHTLLDPIPAAAEFVPLLQTAITRSFSMFEPVVATVGTLRAGSSQNVVPDTAEVGGTARSFSKDATQRVREVLHRVANGVAEAHDMTATVDIEELCIPTVSADAEADFATETARRVSGSENVHVMEQPSTASEDFCWVLDEVPGVFAVLGACPPDGDPATASSNHSQFAVFDDAVIERGVAFEEAWVVDRLARLANG